ncbi:hypothetical protein ACFOTA_08585 [Chitinophaga sp. GCM10012297]|uniref:Uncharacterized protein n=1 Tax=Chitinophaga chungangae TaxID=2821488 RepID=A0ABS3YCS1_9BACT|nr:hypothetical protein [Chitinophaga chungangae]MBO9152260.1 hypothetical protein [Chitinophaga chungangae]
MNRLNQLVYVRFAPGDLICEEGQMPVYLDEIRNEKFRITADLRNIDQQSASASWDANARALRQYQMQTVAMLDVLQLFRQQAAKSLHVFYGEVSCVLLDILIALEQHFPEYLARDIYMPEAYARHVVTQLEPRVRALEKQLLDKKADRELVRLIFAPLRQPAGQLTFGTIMYYRRLVQDLQTQQPLRHMTVNERIHHILYAYNFNSPELFRYTTRMLRRKVSQLRTLQEKKALLIWYGKELKNMPANEYALHHGKGSIRGQLQEWIKEEKLFLHTLFTTWSS